MNKTFLSIFLIASCLVGRSNQTAIDSLSSIISSAEGVKKINAQVELSQLKFDINPTEGLELAQLAVKECKSINNKELSSSAYLNLGILYQKTTSYTLSLYFYKKSLESKTNNEGVSKIMDNIGVVYREMCNYDSALIFHKQSMKYCETSGDVKGVAFALNSIGNVYVRKGDVQLAIEYYNKALAIRIENKYNDEVAASYENLGDAYKKINEYDKAHDYLFKSLAMRQEQRDREKEAACLNTIGNFYLQMKIYDRAREFYSRALEIRIELGNKSNIASIYNNIGTLHREVANYEKALEYFKKALEIRKQLGNKEAIATSFNSIGSLYWNKKDYAQAIEYYKLALEIRKELGEEVQIAATLKNLGIIYKDKSEYEKALDYYQQSLDIYMKIKDYTGLAYIQNLKGNLFKKNKNYDKSIEFYKNAYSIYKEYKQRKELSSVANNLGEVCNLNKQPQASIQYYNLALDISKEIRDKEQAKSAALGLSESYKIVGNCAKSLEFYTIYSAYKDSIQVDMNKKRIAEIEFEGTLKLKDNEITNQKLKITEKETKIKQQYLFILGIILIAILVVIFTIIVLFQFSQKKKAYTLLAEKGLQLADANSLLGEKNRELGIKNDQITDSITYAKRIQEAILPTSEAMNASFPLHFILYRPKEIVSGDFFWLSEQDGCTYIAVVDCTGHGVPGAFMSMIGNTLLNEIVNGRKVSNTAEILTKLDEAIIVALKQNTMADKRQEDGMDISLCKIDRKNDTIEFSAANHKLVTVQDGILKTFEGDGYPIGGMVKIKLRKNAQRTSTIIPIVKGLRVYMHSDGYIDQFGGANDERFKTPKFHEAIVEIQHMDLHEQYLALTKKFDEWKGNRKQLDDVLVIGFEF